MNLKISCTAAGVKTYPLHEHNNYEIIHYLKGTGFLRTGKKNYPFTPSTIIIVPPGIAHGSTSENVFKNISIEGDFNHLLKFSSPTVLTDKQDKEGRKLAEIIYANRYGNKDFLSCLSTAYMYYLLQNIQTENNIGICIREIISEISSNAFDSDFNTTALLSKSGYSEDYIRNQFKKITGKTPIAFLTDIRIKHSCYLIDIYKDILSLEQIAEASGFVDYAYFSRKFKAIIGKSPTEYKKALSRQNNNKN